MKSAMFGGSVIPQAGKSTSGGQRKSKCVVKLEKMPLFGGKSPYKKDQELILYQFLVLLWLRRQDSKRPLKFSFVLKGAYNLHYLQKTAHLFQMMRIFTIVHILVREKIRENPHFFPSCK